MLLRNAIPDDQPALEALNIGPLDYAWQREVQTILAGLIEWRNDPTALDLDRQVVVLDDNGEISAVCAHERLRIHGRPQTRHRYLMVTAVDVTHQRHGLARSLIESILDDLRRHGVDTVEWLVHPANHASLSFSRRTFPTAEETHPPDDKPYTGFELRLSE